MPVMEQNLDLSGDHRGLSAMTEDGTLLRFDSILRFARCASAYTTTCLSSAHRSSTSPASSPASCATRSPTFAPMALLPSARSALRHAAPRTAAPARPHRALCARAHRRALRRPLSCRRSDRHPAPDELADALNAVINAQAEAHALYARAETDNQQRVLAAERGVAIARQQARAAAEEARVLSAHLTRLHESGVLPAYIARRRAEVYSEARSLFLHEPDALGLKPPRSADEKEAA